MAVNLRTRKPVTGLAPADLEAFPVWEFAIDEEGAEGQDETWVRPIGSRGVPRGKYSLQVATEFRTACGQRYPAFSIVTTAQGQVEIQGAILLIGGEYLPADDPDALLSCTGLTATELFPMTFELRVLIEGEQERRRGVLLPRSGR